jgi:large subunit ribosomal protein L13
MQTYHAKPSDAERNWVQIDATGLVLGRLSSTIAKILLGKTKPTYTPHCDVGDFVVVTNAEKVKFTGTKINTKQYFSHTGYPGGKRWTSLERMMMTHPERVIERAVKGMMPRTRLGRKQLKKLKVYVGPEHPHSAQQPVQISL